MIKDQFLKTLLRCIYTHEFYVFFFPLIVSSVNKLNMTEAYLIILHAKDYCWTICPQILLNV